MDNWRIIADSSCDLNIEGFESPAVGFNTVPLKIIVGENEFVDTPSNVNDMLIALKKHKGPSSSACPSPFDFAEEFKKAKNSIAITVTSALSGTYNSALQATKMVIEEFPEKMIHVIDSRATSGTMILLANKLKELIECGLPFDEVVEQIEKYNSSLKLLFSLTTFDNLVKNGRMSRTAGVLATALGIRAVAVNSEQGTIEVLEKHRGEPRAIEAMVKLMSKFKDMTDNPVVISHCNNIDGANNLKKVIESTYKVKEISIVECKCLTSFYAGDRGLLLAF